MALFLSKYINAIDKKGRVSVPAQFRNALAGENFAGIVMYASIKNKSIEACGLSKLEALSSSISKLDPYSEERDAFETIILGGAVQLAFDGEGRIILPKEFIDLAAIDNQVAFLGKGEVFELWNPDILSSYIQSAKEIAIKNKLLLKNNNQDSI